MEMAKGILEATFTHSKNLACFVFTYKTLTNLMAWCETHEKQYQSFIAAFIGGYIVFGRYNKVNEQVGTGSCIFKVPPSKISIFFLSITRAIWNTIFSNQGGPDWHGP